MTILSVTLKEKGRIKYFLTLYIIHKAGKSILTKHHQENTYLLLRGGGEGAWAVGGHCGNKMAHVHLISDLLLL